MSRGFAELARRWRAHADREPVRVDLLVRPYANAPGADVVLGSFDVAAGRFRRTAWSDTAGSR